MPLDVAVAILPQPWFELGTGSPLSDLLFAAIVSLGFAVQATVGFGSMLVIVGLAGQLLPIGELVPIGVLLSLVPNSMLTLRYRRHVGWRILLLGVLPMMLIGVPAGVVLMAHLPVPTVRGIYGALILAMASRELLRMQRKLGPEAPLGRWAAGALLLVGGVIHGMFTTSGPMVVTVLGRLGLSKQTFRSTLLALWLSLGLWTAGTLVIAERLDGGTVWTALRLLPTLLIGTWLGDRLHRRVDPLQFARWVQVLLVLSGLSLIVRALGG